MAEYDCRAIKVLKGLEPVRLRPGMYVGSTTDGSGLHHMLWEIVANVMDQYLAGNASELCVELASGWITVRDDGPGIPTDLMPPPRPFRVATAGLRPPQRAHVAPADTLDVLEQQHEADDDHADDGASVEGEDSISVLEAICTRLHAGPTRDGHFPHVHLAPSMFGVGIAAVNALSERFEVETTYRDVRWTQAFERGERVSPLRRIGPSRSEGTTVRFRPDPTIFSSIELDHTAVLTRLHELAWLNPHLRVYFQEQRIAARGGIAGWARALASERGLGVEHYEVVANVHGIRVNVGLAWNRSGAPIVRSFVNMQPTLDGSHVNGLWLGLADYARGRKSPAGTVKHVREAIGCGLVAVIEIGMYAPRFGSPTRDQLNSPEAAKAVRAAVREHLEHMETGASCVRRFLDARLQVR